MRQLRRLLHRRREADWLDAKRLCRCHDEMPPAVSPLQAMGVTVRRRGFTLIESRVPAVSTSYTLCSSSSLVCRTSIGRGGLTPGGKPR